MVMDATRLIEVMYDTQLGGYTEHSPNMEMDYANNTPIEVNFTYTQTGESLVMVPQTQINMSNAYSESIYQAILDSPTTLQETWNMDGQKIAIGF